MEDFEVTPVDYIMAREWTKPNKLIIVMSLIDVSYLFKPETSNTVKQKFGTGGFTLRDRGDTMKRLTEELQNSADKKIRKHLTVHEFYHFYLYFKEVMPVMNHLSQRYQDS